MGNSVVTGDLSAFEVPLSYIDALYNPCNPNRAKSKLKIFVWVPTVIAYIIKKELDVYLRVLGSSDQNTDLDITLPLAARPIRNDEYMESLLSKE